MKPENYAHIIENALREDIGAGDLTSEAIFTSDQTCQARLIAKQDGVVAGLAVFVEAFHAVDPRVRIDCELADGARCSNRQTVCTLHGPVLSVLQGERVALNLLQRMSGIATLTRQFVDAANDRLDILDTRKTAPGLRVLDKWAVRLGGGKNHRHGLYDMALIKENHIQAAGGIRAAVDRVLAHDNHKHPIEVEVTNLDELREALQTPVDRVMLDNMSPALMQQAVAITDGRVPLEASGNITLERIDAIAASGVQCVSIGALTHSVQALDYSLLVD